MSFRKDGLDKITKEERMKKHITYERSEVEEGDCPLDPPVYSLEKAEAERWEESVVIEGIENPENPLEGVPREIVEKLESLTSNDYESFLKRVDKALEIANIDSKDIDAIPNEHRISGLKKGKDADGQLL